MTDKIFPVTGPNPRLLSRLAPKVKVLEPPLVVTMFVLTNIINLRIRTHNETCHTTPVKSRDVYA